MTARIPLFILLAAAVALPAQAADLFVQPYLQVPTPNSILVLWETDADSNGAVEYGTTEAFGSKALSLELGTRHNALLPDLEPNTLYHYRVQVDGEPAGTTGTFSTAPATAVPFTFLVYGDTRSDAVAHATVISRMMEYPAAFVINTGDLVSSGEVVAQWEEFFGVVWEMARDMVLFPAIGNHDQDKKKMVESWGRFFRMPEDGAAHPSYYAWTWSNARFLVLDMYVASESSVDCLYRIGSFEECLDQGQTAWLEGQLADIEQDPAIDHAFVFVHIGPYSSKPNRSGSAEMRSLLPRFLSAKVKTVFSGHDHYYEHGIAANRLHYIISGGGGAPLYETAYLDTLEAYPRGVEVSTSVYNFQVVNINGKEIEISSYEGDGSLLERFTIDERPECETADECALGEPGFCDGKWTCDGLSRCAWVCNPPPDCDSVLDCEDPPTDACVGGWACIDHYCVWQCDALPECAEAVDCEGQEPPIQCPHGGTWACPLETCEWTCNPPPTEDPGATPDAGPEVAPDAAVTDPGIPEDTNEPTPPVKTKSSGGCAVGTIAGGPGSLLLPALSFLGAWAWRRRKAERPNR